jgi:hypothetical protein
MKNPTLFGLKTNSSIKLRYNVEQDDVVEIIGLNVTDPNDVEISELKCFNLPQFISVAGVPYYPSKYEFSTGDIWYHARRPPAYQIRLEEVGMLGERAKVMAARITPSMLDEFDKPAKLRPRRPDQRQVMGESAAEHAKKLIARGTLVVPPDSPAQWQWCHLVAFTMLPINRAQTRRNLIAGTAACNGHMANIEAAVKMFIYETGRAVSLEVTATIIADTHLGRRIRYQVVEQKSGLLFREYFDALTDVRSDHADFENIYDKLMSEYRKT